MTAGPHELEIPKAGQSISVDDTPHSALFGGVGFSKLLAGCLGFALLTVGIIWYQFHRIQDDDGTPGWSQLQWGYLFLIVLGWPIETVASGLRAWLICRILQPGVGLWTCCKAEWANVAIGMLTPSQSGSGLGQVYLLSRGGARVDTAITVCFLSFTGTMAGLFCMGLYSVLIVGLARAGPLFLVAAWAIVAIGLAIVLAALWPDSIRFVLVAVSRTITRLWARAAHPGDSLLRGESECLDRLTTHLIDILYACRDNLHRFLRDGKGTFACVCLLSLIFLLSRALMPYLCLRFLGINTSTFRRVVEAQVALIFLLFFAPTPGGAGVAEAAALSIMEDILPAGFAPYYTLLWRSLTLYLAALAGLFCLAHALIRDGKQVIRGQWQGGPGPDQPERERDAGDGRHAMSI